MSRLSLQQQNSRRQLHQRLINLQRQLPACSEEAARPRRRRKRSGLIPRVRPHGPVHRPQPRLSFRCLLTKIFATSARNYFNCTPALVIVLR